MPQVFDDEKMFWIMTSLIGACFTIICGLAIYIWKDNKAEKVKDRQKLDSLREVFDSHVTTHSLFKQETLFHQKQTDNAIENIQNDNSSIKRTLAYHGRTLRRLDNELRNSNGNRKQN